MPTPERDRIRWPSRRGIEHQLSEPAVRSGVVRRDFLGLGARSTKGGQRWELRTMAWRCPMRRCITWAARFRQPRSQREHARCRSKSGRPCIPVLQHTLLANSRRSVCHWSLAQARPHNTAGTDLSPLVKQPYLRTGIPAVGPGQSGHIRRKPRAIRRSLNHL